MAYEATPAAAAWRVFWPTRMGVLLVAVFAALSFGPASGGLAAENAVKFDTPHLTHAFADPLLAPLARWDAVWYLRVAESGYGESEARAAFFPLYPLLVRGLATPFGASPAALLVAAYAVALGAFLGALTLLYRLVSLELGRPLAGPTLLLLAVFPAALYFGAPYAESLFLALSVGAFYAARTGRWAWAGACAAAAAATRNSGVLLMVPLADHLVGLARAARGRRRLGAPRPARAGRVRALPGPGRGRRPALHARPRGLVSRAVGAARGCLGGARRGCRRRAPAGVGPDRGRLLHRGRGGSVPDRRDQPDLFGSLVFGVAACVGVFRRLPPAYGAWVAVSLLLPLSEPVKPQPLMSLPRFLAVLFPIFMWLAVWCEERRATDRVVAVSALGLGLFTAQFASWHWIS